MRAAEYINVERNFQTRFVPVLDGCHYGIAACLRQYVFVLVTHVPACFVVRVCVILLEYDVIY